MINERIQKYVNDHSFCSEHLFKDWEAFLDLIYEEGCRVSSIYCLAGLGKGRSGANECCNSERPKSWTIRTVIKRQTSLQRGTETGKKYTHTTLSDNRGGVFLQEDLTNRTIALSIRTATFTARTLQNAIRAVLQQIQAEERKEAAVKQQKMQKQAF